jgi:hypothetical protein
MNEVTGFPAPTLPAPGSAPVATAPAVPSPTAFAVPSDARADLPAPSAATPLTAPSLPGVAAPTLPPVGVAAPPVPASGPSAAPDLQADAGEDEPGSAAKTTSSWAGKFVPVLLLVGAGALSFIGFSNMSDESSDGAAEPAPVTVAPVATSPLVAPINDAEAVVDQINENTLEEELFDELDLGPSGEVPVTGASSVDGADLTLGGAIQLDARDAIRDDLVSVLGAPTFKYIVQRGAALQQAIWVDSSSGNRELFDGTTYVRIVDGVAYSTADPAGAWIVDPASAPTDPLAALTEMVTFERVLPAELLDLVAVSSLQGESGTGRYLFIDTELAAFAGETRTAWLASWGFDSAVAPTEVDGVVDGVPDIASPGMILVSVVSSTDGVVTALTIDAPGIGESVSYRLEGASTAPLTIGVPTAVVE